MKTFPLLCCAVCVSLSVFLILLQPIAIAQEIEEPVASFSEPVLISGDPVRCQIVPVIDEYNANLYFPEANASSQDSKRDSLRCQVELDAEMRLAKGWYLHSIQHTTTPQIGRFPEAKAAITARSTFQKKTVLRFRETQPAEPVPRSNQIQVSSLPSRAKQCSGAIQTVKGKIILDFDLQTQGIAQASLNIFDVVLIPAQCNS